MDYWDFQGWRDRFSSRAYSRRQQQYAANFALPSAYTPQAIVDGRAEAVGNDRGAIAKAVQGAAKRAKAEVHITRAGPDLLDVVVRGGGRADVLLAITESGLATAVGGGENKGRTLRHAAVVRAFQPLGRMNDSFHAVARLHLDPSWDLKNCHAVILVQRSGQAEMVGAAAIALAHGTP